MTRPTPLGASLCGLHADFLKECGWYRDYTRAGPTTGCAAHASRGCRIEGDRPMSIHDLHQGCRHIVGAMSGNTPDDGVLLVDDV